MICDIFNSVHLYWLLTWLIFIDGALPAFKCKDLTLAKISLGVLLYSCYGLKIWKYWDRVEHFEVPSAKWYLHEFRDTISKKSAEIFWLCITQSKYFRTLFTYCLGGVTPSTSRGVPEHHNALWLISNSLTHTTGLVTLAKIGKLNYHHHPHLHHHHTHPHLHHHHLHHHHHY